MQPGFMRWYYSGHFRMPIWPSCLPHMELTLERSVQRMKLAKKSTSLSAFFHGTKYFSDRHVDTAYCNAMAGLRSYEIKVPVYERHKSANPVLKEFKEGFLYTFSYAPIKYTILLLALISLMRMPYVLSSLKQVSNGLELAIEPTMDDIVIPKNTASMFIGTHFEYLLRNGGITNRNSLNFNRIGS